MKKLFIITAMLSLSLLLSCSKSETVKISSNSQISFNSFNTIATSRAANDNSDNYKVYALVTQGSTKAALINGEDVSSSDNSILSGINYYWPVYEGSVVDLFAYAPANLAYTIGTTDTSTKWSYTVPDSGDKDFTIAYPVQRTCPELDSTTGGIPSDSDYSKPVDFVFYHQLANVEFEVSLSETLTKAGFTLDLKNFYVDFTVKLNKATFDYSCPSTDGSNMSSATLEVASTDEDEEDDAVTPTSVTYSQGTSYYIIPQAGAGCTLELLGAKVYSPTDSDFDILDGKVITPYVIESSDNITFKQGYLYTIKVTFDDSLTTGEGDEVFTHIEIFSTTLNEWISNSDSQTDTSTEGWNEVQVD